SKTKITLEKRRTAIKELLITYAVEDQNMLIGLLKEKYDIDATQTAISRDLHSLGIVKKKSGNKIIYEMPSVDVQKEILQLAIKSVEHNESMIVVKTVPAMAAFVGDYLDECQDLGLLGNIAGENTIFIIPESTKSIAVICANVKKALYTKEVRDE
ncbi:MAG: hypothetical protein ACQEP8_05740, partial [Chlamydiota bacterium]